MEKPVIAVTPLWDDRLESIWMLPGYLDGLRAAGALPLTVPLEADEDDARQIFDLCDGLLLTGGHDVDPALYARPRSPSAPRPAPAGTRWSARCFPCSARAASLSLAFAGACSSSMLSWAARCIRTCPPRSPASCPM